MEISYETLSQAIRDIQAQGYTEDFNLCAAGIENKSKKIIPLAVDLEVTKHYRFEGMSNLDDNAILYVIETNTGEKGLLVDAYGAYSGNIPGETLNKLRLSHE
jgi:hypothetical protein